MRLPWQHLPFPPYSTRYFSSLPSRCSPAFSSNLTRPTPSTSSNTPLNLLYLNVSHSPNSLVAVGAQALLEGIKREHKVQEIDLWSKKGLKYSIEHAQAKMAMLGGEATREEEERFAPVMTAAEEVNKMDIVLIGLFFLILLRIMKIILFDGYHSEGLNYFLPLTSQKSFSCPQQPQCGTTVYLTP